MNSSAAFESLLNSNKCRLSRSNFNINYITSPSKFDQSKFIVLSKVPFLVIREREKANLAQLFSQISFRLMSILSPIKQIKPEMVEVY